MENKTPLLSWAKLIDKVKKSESARKSQDKLIATAREIVNKEVIRRVYRVEDIGKHRSWLDGRSNALEEQIRETFALAMSDHMACSILSTELPLLATVFRLTGKTVFRRRVIEQLTEMTKWCPIQRPGWTCFANGNRLPPDGKDGNWLATGSGIRAIADTLEIMPPNTIDSKLRVAIELLLKSEVESVVDDWKSQRPWFVKSDNPRTNQWVLPTEGLIRSSMLLGVDKYNEAYEFGMTNMLKSLDSHGSAGEFDEGLLYSVVTMVSIVSVARATAMIGDCRLINHSYFKYFPTWMIHHLQPDRKLINSFDCFMCEAPRDNCGDSKGWSFRQLLSLLAICFPNSAAHWGLFYQFDEPSVDLPGLACAILPRPSIEKTPSCFAIYERATRINWRDSWDDDATGLWIRGGNSMDQHDHRDRGHVNFSLEGVPVLIEAGTPSYHNPCLGSYFAAGSGHNVLQLGLSEWSQTRHTPLNQPPGWQKVKTVAPISITKLDEGGGDALVDVTDGYDALKKWTRRCVWNSKQLKVEDNVVIGESRDDDIILFRWHLAIGEPVVIQWEKQHLFTVACSSFLIEIEGSQPLFVLQEILPDQSLAPREWDDASPDNLHSCVVVRTKHPQNSLTLTSTFIGR